MELSYSHYFSQDPEPLPYLKHEDKYNYDINLEVLLKGKRLKVVTREICRMKPC